MDDRPTPAVRALDAIEGILDGLDAAQADRGARLVCAQRARAVASRLTALAALWLAKADATQESLREAGTPTTSWLTVKAGMSKREAAGFLHQAQELAAHPDVADAATAGRISVSQARAIHTVLGGLHGLNDGQQAQAEELLLDLAGTMDSDRLAKAAPQVLAQVAPHQADENLERRLQRQAEAAHHNRSLVFGRDGNGSVTFTGSLPLVDGEAWIAILDAYTESRRRTALEERDPVATSLTPQQRRADALAAMITNHQQGKRAPKVAGDRPRVVVTLDYDKLLREAAAAGLIGQGEPLSAGDLRRLCCDGGLLPAVLGGPSQVLDVGRERRLVTPDIRAALDLRDGGCIFPGCETRACACEAHHVVPWWAGGKTALCNLCLLCHHHHALLEPARYGTRDQWEVRIAEDGVPEVIPPRRCDPQRRPSRHARFRARVLAKSA
ncbi:MAG TPA: DUF222 domain-containing protein [Propionicimonas sp.]|uniref:HNH endonuclease signature motif containing protein n=1 Tax=Propionicimonas sp. TaxID=1955623 RepID=UPI002F40F25F